MGSCLGKAKSEGPALLRNTNRAGQFDLAITDPDLGWRRKARHTNNPNAYPVTWAINGIRPPSGEEVHTDMIRLSIAASHYAYQIWNKYTAIGRMDENIDIDETDESRDHSIHTKFGLLRLEWRLLERCRPFKCSEVNPCGIQGASTLAKIETVDNKGTVDVKDRQTTNHIKVEDLVSQGSSWREGDRVQVMVHKLSRDSTSATLGQLKRRHFFIDSAEIALNIIEFERRIGKLKGTFSELIDRACENWITDPDVVHHDERVQKYLEQKSGDFQDDRCVRVISPDGKIYEFVPEELCLSVTSRLQEAFMTQSAF